MPPVFLVAQPIQSSSVLFSSDIHINNSGERIRANMVIGLLLISAIPTTVGVCQALSAQKKADAAAKEKAKFHLTATVCLDENGPVECWCVLKDGKVSPTRALPAVDHRVIFPSPLLYPGRPMTSVKWAAGVPTPGMAPGLRGEPG